MDKTEEFVNRLTQKLRSLPEPDIKRYLSDLKHKNPFLAAKVERALGITEKEEPVKRTKEKVKEPVNVETETTLYTKEKNALISPTEEKLEQDESIEHTKEKFKELINTEMEKALRILEKREKEYITQKVENKRRLSELNHKDLERASKTEKEKLITQAKEAGITKIGDFNIDELIELEFDLDAMREYLDAYRKKKEKAYLGPLMLISFYVFLPLGLFLLIYLLIEDSKLNSKEKKVVQSIKR